MTVDWNKFRRIDRTLNLREAIFKDEYLRTTFSDNNERESVATVADCVEAVQPIASRQVAALILVTASFITMASSAQVENDRRLALLELNNKKF